MLYFRIRSSCATEAEHLDSDPTHACGEEADRPYGRGAGICYGRLGSLGTPTRGKAVGRYEGLACEQLLHNFWDMLRVGDEVRVRGGQDGMLVKEGMVVYVPPASIAWPPGAFVRLISVTHASGAPAAYVARWYEEKDVVVIKRQAPPVGMVKAVGGPCDGGELPSHFHRCTSARSSCRPVMPRCQERIRSRGSTSRVNRRPMS